MLVEVCSDDLFVGRVSDVVKVTDEQGYVSSLNDKGSCNIYGLRSF